METGNAREHDRQTKTNPKRMKRRQSRNRARAPARVIAPQFCAILLRLDFKPCLTSKQVMPYIQAGHALSKRGPS